MAEAIFRSVNNFVVSFRTNKRSSFTPNVNCSEHLDIAWKVFTSSDNQQKPFPTDNFMKYKMEINRNKIILGIL